VTTYAYDQSDGRATPTDVLTHDGEGVLVYSGLDRPDDSYLVPFDTDTLHHAWTFESSRDRAVAGNDDQNYRQGVSDCQWHEGRIPAGYFTYVVACDLNNNSLAGRNTQPYLQGWSDTTREPAFGQYGSSDAINQGMRLGGKLQKFWGVVNWNPLGYPDNHPANIQYWINLGVDLIQLIGTPIPGTDQNIVAKPNWWSASTTAPVRRMDDMYIGVNKTEGWFIVEGGKISAHFIGTPNAYGIPSDLSGNWVNVPTHALTDTEVSALKTTPVSGGNNTSVQVIDYDAIQRAVTEGIKGL
jgi:hypothetical protein